MGAHIPMQPLQPPSNGKPTELDVEVIATYRAPTYPITRASDADPIREVEAHSTKREGAVWTAAFSPDGKTLAIGNYDGSVQLFTTADWKETHLLEGHTWPVNSVAFSPDGRRLVTASMDKSVRLWDTQTGKMVLILPNQNQFAFSVAFSPDGKLFATQQGGVHLWDAATGQEVRALHGQIREAMHVAFSPDGHLLAAGGADNSVELWNARTWQLERTLDGRSLKGPKGTVLTVAFSPDSKLLAMGGQDGLVAIWNTATGQLVHTLKNLFGSVSSVAFSSDGKLLAVGENDEAKSDVGPGNNAGVTLWNTSDWHLARTFVNHKTNEVDCLAISPDNSTLVTCDWSTFVHIWAMPGKVGTTSH
jgi:WD40 repeat protein